MSNRNKDSKLYVGVVIGGVVGVGALAIYLATRQNKAPMDTIGNAIARVGEILESHNIEQPAPLKKVERQIHKHGNTAAEVLDWVATGIQLWKKF